MTTYLGKSCSFCLPRVPFVNCRQFMYLVISLLVLRAGYGIWLYQFLIIAYLFTFNVHKNNSVSLLQPFALNKWLVAIPVWSGFNFVEYMWRGQKDVVWDTSPQRLQELARVPPMIVCSMVLSFPAQLIFFPWASAIANLWLKALWYS